MHQFRIFIGLLWVGFYVYWLISGLQSNKNVRGSSWGQSLLTRFAAVIVIVGLLGRQTMRSAEWTHGSSNLLFNLAAAAVCAAGFGFAVWARRHIGRNWGVPMSVKAKTELVTTGPYGLVRHPIYSGILLALLGSAPIFGLRLIVVAVAFGAYAIYSATVEERNMESLFPGQYAEYRRRTKFLIPWIF